MGSKKNRNHDTYDWTFARRKQQEAFLALLSNEVLRRDVFNDKYFEGLEKRLDALREFGRKIQLVVWTTALFLIVTVLAVRIPISFFGFASSEPSGMREILLLILATAPLASLFPAINQRDIEDQIKAYIDHTSKGDATIKAALLGRYGFPPPFFEINSSPKPPMTILTAIGGIGAAGFMLFVPSLLFLVEIVALIAIVLDPTISRFVGVMVAIYVALATLFNFSMRAMHGLNHPTTARASTPRTKI